MLSRSLLPGCLAALAVLAAPTAASAQSPLDRPIAAPAPNIGAQDVARAAGLECRVRSATYLGRTGDYQPIYEAVCRDGPGYLLVGGPEPLAFNCLALEAQLEAERARANGRSLPQACRTPGNRNAVPVVTRFARQAGLACRVDEGALIGLSTRGRFIYEAGCADEVGAWLEEDGDGWVVTDCLIVTGQGGECRFTNGPERARRAQRWVETTEAGEAGRRCAPVDARYMGGDVSGAWYEAECASGDGLVVRLDSDGNVAEVLACADADRVGAGCRGRNPGIGQPPA